MHAAVLQSADHFQAGAVANVAQPAKGVTAEGALQNLSVVRAIEKRSPLFEFPHTIGSFLGVDLRHAPVVEQLAAAHGVTKMSAPVVRAVYVGHRGGDSSLRHDGMRFAEKRFANHAHLRALFERSQSRTQARATGADDQDIVVVSFVLGGHNSLRSRTAPLATSRI